MHGSASSGVIMILCVCVMVGGCYVNVVLEQRDIRGLYTTEFSHCVHRPMHLGTLEQGDILSCCKPSM